MERQYCYKAVVNSEYILFIGNTFGLYHVFATNEERSYCYSIYGGYRHIGTASNRLLESAKRYDGVSRYYASKKLILEKGAFGM